MNRKTQLLLVLLVLFSACGSDKKSDIPVIGFVEAFEDATIKQAKNGFVAEFKLCLPCACPSRQDAGSRAAFRPSMRIGATATVAGPKGAVKG